MGIMKYEQITTLQESIIDYYYNDEYTSVDSSKNKGNYLLYFDVFDPESNNYRHLKKVSSNLKAGIVGEDGIEIMRLEFNIDWKFQPEEKQGDTLDLLQAFVLNNCNIFNECYKSLSQDNQIKLGDMYSDYIDFKIQAEKLLLLLYGE